MLTRTLLFLFFTLLCVDPAAALNFPFGAMAKVDQTYGDFNGGNLAEDPNGEPDRYHDGIDSPGSLGQAVISPISGELLSVVDVNFTGYVCVKDSTNGKVWAFGHIKPENNLSTTVVAGVTQLGVLQDFPKTQSKERYYHVHIGLAKSAYSCNKGESEDPLQYFSPVTQSLNLVSADIMFSHDNTAVPDRPVLAAQFQTVNGLKVIHDDTDIVVLGRDNINEGNRSGVYRIDYRISNVNNVSVVPERTVFTMYGPMYAGDGTLNFTYLAPPTRDPGDGSPTDWENYYNITNSGPTFLNPGSPPFAVPYLNIQKHAWQTKVRHGQEDNDAMSAATGDTDSGGDAAASVSHDTRGLDYPKYPDGIYTVVVKTYAYPPSATTLETNRSVMVDNFRPYLERTEIVKSDDGSKYLHMWSFDGSNLNKDGPIPNTVLGAGDYTINFQFSEEVTSPTLFIDGPNGPLELPIDSDPSGNQKNFSAKFTVGENSPIQDGLRTLTFNAVDLAGNYILALTPAEKIINPNSEITRNNFGIMQGNSNGTSNPGDRSVDFILNRRPFVQKVAVGGENGYVKEWVKGASGYTRSETSNPVYGRTVPILLTFSEPVQNPTLSIDKFSGITLAPWPSGQQATYRGYIYPDFNNIPFMEEGLRKITITGTDLQGNELLALGLDDTAIAATQLTVDANGVLGGTPGPDTSSLFLLDNFRPFLYRARIEKGAELKYSKQWALSGTDLGCAGPAVNLPLGKGAYAIKLLFSEAVANPKLEIDNFRGLPLASNEPSGSRYNYSAAFTLDKDTVIEDGIRTMIVHRARDSGNNALLLLSPEQQHIDLDAELTRDPESGLMRGASMADYSVNFTVDLTPPMVYLPDQDGINNIQTKPVMLTVGKQTSRITDDPNGLCFDIAGDCREVSGLQSFKIYTYPGGAEVAGKTAAYDPPELEDKVLPKSQSPLPIGEYVFEVIDAVGNITGLRVKVADFSLEVSTVDSHIDIHRETNSFTGKIHIKAQASSGLLKLALLDRFLTSVDEAYPSGASMFEGDLNVSGSLDDYYFRTNNFGAGFIDQDGRIVWQPLNLMFSDAKSHANSFARLQTAPYTTPVLDLTKAMPEMISNGIMSIYAPTKGEINTLPLWQYNDRNGFYGTTTGNAEGWIAASLPADPTRREDIGKLKVVTRTWNDPDKTDVVEYPVATRDLFLIDRENYVRRPGEILTCGNQLGYEPLLDFPEVDQNSGGLCYVEHEAKSQVIPIKRYMQSEITLERVAPSSVLICRTIEEVTPGEAPSDRCTSIYYFVPAYHMVGPAVYGMAVNMGAVQNAIGAVIPSGHNIKLDLYGGISVDFGANTVFTPGILNFSYASVDNYPGYLNLSGNLALSLQTQGTFDHARLTIPYNAEGLTSAQEAGIKVYKITADGEYIALGSTVDTVNKKVQSSELDSFGRIMVAAPRYADPRTAASAASVLGKPELEFTAEGVSVDNSVFELNTPEGAALLASVAEKGLLLGNVYKLGREDLPEGTRGTLKMRFGAALTNPVSIYHADTDGTGFYKLTGTKLDPVNLEIAADIEQPEGLYLLVGSTTAAVTDRTPPAVTVSYSEPKYNLAGKLYVSTQTTVSLAGTDAGAGIGTFYYLIDDSPALGTAVRYAGPFTLEEGVRTLYYSGSDKAGNMPAFVSEKVYVDGTPPTVDLLAGNERYAGGTSGYIVEGSSITLFPLDPEVNGVASGLKEVYALIDVTPEECGAGGVLPAACQNRVYTGPFTLPVGTHTVYYGAMDHVGNIAAVESVYIDARKPVVVKFFPAQKSADSILWQWDAVEGATGYQVFSSTGGAVSAVLAGATSTYLQAGLSPNIEQSGFLKVYTNSETYVSGLSVVVTLANMPGIIETFNIAQTASLVIGQPNFVATNMGLGPDRLAQPTDVSFDKTGELWIVDGHNNRVLRFSPPFFNGMSANLVIGEPDFYSRNQFYYNNAETLNAPSAMAFDSQDNLWVLAKDRIVRFSRPFSNHMSADLIIGADSFYAVPVGATAANRLHNADRGKITFDSGGNLWVSDLANHRVLRFTPPYTTGMSADLVIGQLNFMSSFYLSPPSASSLSYPAAVEVDPLGNLWIADAGNDRVLRFKPPFYSGMSAELVLGQRNFISNNSITGIYPYPPSASGLNEPYGLEFAPDSSLYVVDAYNNRVLKFRPPFVSGMDAAFVLGQYDFTSKTNLVLAGSFLFPRDTKVQGAISSDAEGRLWVADFGYNRVLGFNPVRGGTFKDVDVNSLTLSWFGNGNPTETCYLAEISKQADFSGSVFGNGCATVAISHFSGLSGNTRYYARVKAKNMSGVETEYLNLGSVLTKSGKVNNFSGVPYSPGSILWTWDQPQTGVEFQIYSSTGDVVSAALPPGTTFFIQTGLAANREYGNFIRSANSAGYTDSAVAYQTTFAFNPQRAESFVNGQDADLVIGQIDFMSSSGGTSANKITSPNSGAFDALGSLWVTDSCRVLRFSPPFFIGMSADLVIGQSDFISRGCSTGAGTLSSSGRIIFDGSGAMWVSDRNANRILRFSPPFISGMSADLVIGQSDFSSSSAGTSANKLNNPRDVRIAVDGSLWVADSYNYRILRFSPPFTIGMSADLVLGQADFVSDTYARQPNANKFSSEAFTIDNSGNLWAADADKHRVLMFSPPFSNGMPASFVLGQTDFLQAACTNTSPTSFCYPMSLAFDGNGNLYLGEPGNHRVLEFQPPFRNIMNASVVFGQSDFSSTGYTLARNKFWRATGLVSQPLDGANVLWVIDGSNQRLLRFGAINTSFLNVAATSVTVAWDGNNNPGGTEYSAQISTDSGFRAGISSPWLTVTTATFTGLLGNTTYYARVKSRNGRQVEGAYRSLGFAYTPEPPRIVAESPVLINGNPEIRLISVKEMTLVSVGSGTAGGVVAIGSATANELTLASNLYELGPDGNYDPPAQLEFYYSTSTLATLGLLESDVAVYEYFTDSGWVRLSDQSLDTVNHKISVPITQISSLFGIFGVIKDRVAPVTEFAVLGSSWPTGDVLYINIHSSITLNAYDPVVHATYTGVAYTEFRVEAGTSSIFTRYASPFTLTEGVQLVEYRSVDNSGNIEAAQTVAFYVDWTAAISTASFSGNLGRNGWFISPVDVEIRSTDSFSGLASSYFAYRGEALHVYSSTFNISSEGLGELKHYAVDHVGNAEPERTLGYKIDISTPAAILTLLPVANDFGWNNTSVDVVFAGTDAVSGIEYCSSSFTVNNEGIGIPVFGYCADYAGWTSTASFSVNIDTTAPLSNAEMAAEPGLNGWLLSPAGITLTSTDSLSGTAGLYYAVDGSSFALYSSSFAVSGEGAHSLKYYSVDRAGNKEAEREFAIKLDLDSPVVSAVSVPAANTHGWNNTAVSVVFSGTDTMSGLAYCEPDKSVETEGSSRTVTGYCSDYAGRSSTAALTVNIDTTAPSLSYTPKPPANQLGWNNSDVAINFACADSLSGVKFCPADILLSSEGVNISTSAAAFDLAGNIRYTTATLKIDRTPPVITISSPAAGQVFIATRGDIGVKFGVTDNLDPSPASGAWLEQVEDRGSPRGARSARLAVANGQSIEPLDIDDGIWRLIVSATDFADNAAQLTGGAFEVIHDVLAPRTGQAITAGPSLTVGATTYITSAARLELTSIDDLVSANDGVGLGVKDQSIRVKSGGSLVKELLFANPAPKQGEAFISTVTGAGLGVADGVYGLAYNASDVLGNIETEKSVLIGLDNTAPASSAELAGTAGGNGWHISTVTISLLATDALSGVAGISYGLDNGAYLAYTSPVETATEGQRTVRFYARDRLGNTEAGKSMDFKIDRTPPVVIATITPAANAAGWHSGMVKAGFSGNDAVSGIAYCEPARTMRAEGRGLELSGYCRDQAGLTSTATAKFNIDLTSPTVVVERAPLANMRGWNNTDVKVTFTCADALSGIKSCPSAATLAGEGAGQGASGTAADYADNSAAASIGGIHIDKTAPASSLSVFGDFWESGSDKYLGLRSKLSLAAADGLGGVEAIEYRIDEAPFGIYSSSFSLLEGIRTIHYRATDKADNTEAAKTALYRVDGTAPVTTHHIGSPYHAAGGVDYITPTTPITFTAEDPVSGGVHSEVSRIEVSLDGSAFSAYTAALKFSEGRHTIKYRAVDNVGNTEVVRSTVIYVDGTKPITELSLSGDQYKSERQYISRRTDIVIAAADPVANDVSVGVKETKYTVDSGVFNDYSRFKLEAEGRRLVSFYSADHVNNVEVAKTAELWVDGTAPLSILDVLGGKQYPGADPGSFYASLATKFGIVSVDPVVSAGAAGVKAIEYADNGGTSVIYAQPISLGEGKHSIIYRAIDRVENTEVFRSTQIYIDNTAPVTSFNIAEPLYIQDGVRYITPASALTFSAIDPLTKEVAAGVERIETAVDGGHWLKYTQALKFAEGRHIIKYRAIDNVGNTEAEKTLELRSDDTPPASKWRVNSGDSAGLGGRFYLNTQGKITLESADPVVAEVTSGLEGIYYGIDSAPADKYSAPLGLAEGIRTVNFSARDNVGNTEVAKSTVIYVDGTGPVSGLTLTGDQYHGDKVHISTRTGIVITSVDPIVNEVASGRKETKYSVDGGLFVNYSLFRLSAEGKRLVSYYSADYVANTETVKTTALWVDNTPPSTELTVAGARYTAPGDGKLYITGDSGIVITSWDSISNDTTSGMLLTKYRIDNGGWQVYSGSFTVAAEGPHTLEYYALDRVQNAEPLKTINLAVDNTPPVTEISLGEPKSEVFALPLLTPSAKITLSALDPVVNGAASGLNSIFYEIKNMRTGALTPVTAYLSPFTMPGQGTFSIRYWSKDNTGNTETPREQIAAVTTWLEDGLAAVSGLEMSGTADISGAVKSNAVVSLSGNARILGDVTASTITLNGKAQITGLQVLRSPSIDPESIILDGIIQNAQAANKNDLVADYLAAGKLVLGSKTGITLTTGTYYFKGMELSGGASIAIAGKVDILVEGGITINGGGSINASDAASRLTIIVSTSAELKFSGGAALAARVYAPYSELKLAGNALLGGHYFVKRAIISGAGNILQAGESLPVAAASPGGGPKTKAAAMPSGSFGILAGPDPAFRLGEVYVFPNPAKGGEAPVFHIETGIADTVKITIYTISGRAAHEHTLTGMPAELDDGNGLSYAYEYVWRGHIPSGVYLYYIEAQKAGQKLKKTGKFSVVR